MCKGRKAQCIIVKNEEARGATVLFLHQRFTCALNTVLRDRLLH